MAAANWARATTTSTGTGNLTLSGVTGFPTFNNVYSTNRRFPYTILDNSSPAQPIEAGIGYLSASTTLVRETILSTFSSSTFDDTSPSAVSLAAGTYNVISPPIAEHVMAASPSSNRNASLAYQKFIYSQHLTVNNAASSGITLTANRLYFIPFWLSTTAECDALGIRVGTGVAATNIRLGIYDVQADGHPGKLIGATTSLSSATSSSDVSGTITTTTRLQPGWYYTAIVSDGAPGVGKVSTGGELQSFLGPASGNLVSMNSAFFASFTFGALPDPAPSTSLTTISAGSAYPTIAMRYV